MTPPKAIAIAEAPAPSGWITWFLAGALVAGTLDILYAIGFSYFRSGVAPSRVLQFVASGALGPAAFQGGSTTAAAGLGFHYLIAFVSTAIYFAAAASQPGLRRRPLLAGALYGLGVYGVMNYVVIPMSQIGPRPAGDAIVVVTGMLVHMIFIGWPIALAARRAFTNP
jgi:hypothetical protein